MLDPYITSYTSLYDDMGPRFPNPTEYRQQLYSQTYEKENPNFSRETAKSFSRGSCRRCHGRGVEHWNKPWMKWEAACQCVKNQLEKLPREDREAILGLKSE